MYLISKYCGNVKAAKLNLRSITVSKTFLRLCFQYVVILFNILKFLQFPEVFSISRKCFQYVVSFCNKLHIFQYIFGLSLTLRNNSLRSNLVL